MDNGEGEKKHPAPYGFIQKGKEGYNDNLPEELIVNKMPIQVEQITRFEEPKLFGDFNDNLMKIRIVPQKSYPMTDDRVLIHESLHAIDFFYYPKYMIEEQQINNFANDIHNAMLENDFCLHPETLEEGKEKENSCFVKVGDEIKLKECDLDIASITVKVRFRDYDRNDEEYWQYNPLEKLLLISKMPQDQEQIMQSSLVHGFVHAVNEIEELNVDKKKLKFLGQHIYQFLKDNKFCFNKKRIPTKQ